MPVPGSIVGKEKAKRTVGDIQEQLAILRRKIRRIDKKYADDAPTPFGPEPARQDPENLFPMHYFIDEWMSGEVVETPHGSHFETEKLYPRSRRHGSMEISNLEELPEDLLVQLSEGAVPNAHPFRWAFLDTETTGLAMGSGTYAFLIGVGRIAADGFRVRQFFMRDFSEEASLLWALDEHLKQFDILVTYNGKAYDQPLLETRFRMMRSQPPFSRLAHMDLLFGARRLWKLRLESCRLVDLETQILGFERVRGADGKLVRFSGEHEELLHRLVRRAGLDFPIVPGCPLCAAPRINEPE